MSTPRLPDVPAVSPPAPESVPGSANSAVDQAVEQVHDRFRVSEGEAHVWYDRFTEVLAHLDPTTLTSAESRQFFDCAHFLKRVVADMLDDTSSFLEDIGFAGGDDAPVDADDVSLSGGMGNGSSGEEDLAGVGLTREGESRDTDESPPVEGSDFFTVKDPEGLSLFLRDLEHFLMLDFDVRQSHTTGKLGKEYLQGACERADELIVEMRGQEDPLQNKDLLRRLELVRRHPSRLLAQVMMKRINHAFPDRPELQFSYGRTLEPIILEEIQHVSAQPQHFDPRVSMCWNMMSAAFLQRMRDSFTVARIQESQVLVQLERLEYQRFEREVAWMLDRYGSIQPSFTNDFLRLLQFAFSRLKGDTVSGERHFFDSLSLGRAQEAFSMEREARAQIEQSTLKSNKCNLPNEQAFILAMQQFHSAPANDSGRSPERRNQPQPPIVVILDLNGFKAVNDHAAPTRITEPLTGMSQLFHKYPLGDQVLYHAGEAMKAALRSGQKLFHLHGDEYALILPGNTPPAVVLRILATMQENLHQLALQFDMHRADDDSFMDLGIAAGGDLVSVSGPYDHDALTAHVSDLMAYAKQNKSLPPPNYRSFADKCSYVLGAGFSRPGRYDRRGEFIEPLAGAGE